ncbi:hypothetical protein GCM10010185_71000 [Saccharothrix coeruleofusca]|uniref:Uncharacterized protein n=1 Tax=Saccharothrix coeruleofusca TaxID=33919 RepID=A0A918AUL4_9PSEU|nr:hypothetical protein GCM10010185_71000 [Saccharothrix coeruleofusca]
MPLLRLTSVYHALVSTVAADAVAALSVVTRPLSSTVTVAAAIPARRRLRRTRAAVAGGGWPDPAIGVLLVFGTGMGGRAPDAGRVWNRISRRAGAAAG